MPKNESTPRVAPQFAVIRSALIHILASQKTPTPTQDIANALGVNRSYVIRLQDLKLKPRTSAERKIMKLADERKAALKKLGFGFIFNGDLTTLLAGGERMSLPRAERGGRPRKDAAPKKEPKPKAPPKKEGAKKEGAKKEGAKKAAPAKSGPPKPKAKPAPKDSKPKKESAAPAKTPTKASTKAPKPTKAQAALPLDAKPEGAAQDAASIVDDMLRAKEPGAGEAGEAGANITG